MMTLAWRAAAGLWSSWSQGRVRAGADAELVLLAEELSLEEAELLLSLDELLLLLEALLLLLLEASLETLEALLPLSLLVLEEEPAAALVLPPF